MKPTRIKLPAPAAYHITSRIKNDDFLLEDNEDKRALLDIIRRAAEFAGIMVVSYAILDNHFHLLAHVPARQEVDGAELERRVRILWGREKAEARFERWRFWEARGKAQSADKERAALRRRMFDITPFVKTIKELFTHSYNRRHAARGAVWGRSRFKSAAVASDFKTLATVSAYIDLNAVRAKIVRHPKNYKWCGLGAARKGDAVASSGIAAMRRIAAGCGGGGCVAVGGKTEDGMTRSGKMDGGKTGIGKMGKGKADGGRGDGGMGEGGRAAVEEYLSFLDGTKNSGGSPVFELKSDLKSKYVARAKTGQNAGNRAGGYVRKTLDSADLSRLGANEVARWLAESDVAPESVSEMWTRRFGNLVIGGVIGPLEAVIGMNDAIYGHSPVRRRWQPGVIDEICTSIRARNDAARKRNIS